MLSLCYAILKAKNTQVAITLFNYIFPIFADC